MIGGGVGCIRTWSRRRRMNRRNTTLEPIWGALEVGRFEF